MITGAKEIEQIEKSRYKFSVCSLVSKKEEYQEMIGSFRKAGFDESFTEYLFIDNSIQNKFESYSGINKFLLEARGQYIIICHQDILLNYDNLEILEKRIEEMNVLDPTWAILSNAGADEPENIIYRITENDLIFKERGITPSKVKSVDENFILVKREANLSLSSNLKGFHLYGTDLCIIAAILGYSAYVINFNLLHKSKGNRDERFFDIQTALQKKYEAAFKGYYIQSTCTRFYLSGSWLGNLFFNSKLAMFFIRKYYKAKYPRKKQIY